MSRTILARAACMALFVALSVGARANDTEFNQTSGGLLFSHNEDIVMRSEVLKISRARIEVRYEFENKTKRDLKLQVAFPLPDFEPGDYNDPNLNVDLVSEDFETTVDGAKVPMQLDRRAILAGLDVTRKLEELGLPIDPSHVAEVIKKIPATTRSQTVATLLELGLIEEYQYDAQWTYRRVFHHERLFPAGKTIVVTHSYKPSVKSTINLAADILADKAMRERYCIDSDLARTLTAIKDKAEKAQGSSVFGTAEINYILSTGANWANGKIGDFRLIIDKGKPSYRLSFCGSDIKKTGPTTFEMHKKDFRPTRELDVLIIEDGGE